MLHYFAFPIFLISFAANAEYRAYQYALITLPAKDQLQKKPTEFMVSSLSPVAFKSYSGLAAKQIFLLRTWMCPGNTARKKICDAPYTQLTNATTLSGNSPGAVKGIKP